MVAMGKAVTVSRTKPTASGAQARKLISFKKSEQ
jgi:hypothetical protein